MRFKFERAFPKDLVLVPTSPFKRKESSNLSRHNKFCIPSHKNYNPYGIIQQLATLRERSLRLYSFSNP